MDLLKQMVANRIAKGVVIDPQPRPVQGRKAPSKKQKAETKEPGSRAMRIFIIEEKPGKKVVRKHFTALVEKECESESDEE
jgi:hypothetical protein